MHRAGVIHTDIKPDNIVLIDGSQVVVRELDSMGVFNDKVCRSVSLHIMPLMTRCLDNLEER